jgi:hypothetical protein
VRRGNDDAEGATYADVKINRLENMETVCQDVEPCWSVGQGCDKWSPGRSVKLRSELHQCYNCSPCQFHSVDSSTNSIVELSHVHYH